MITRLEGITRNWPDDSIHWIVCRQIENKFSGGGETPEQAKKSFLECAKMNALYILDHPKEKAADLEWAEFILTYWETLETVTEITTIR